MEDKDDRAPPRPGASFAPEQGAWSSPARGIALGLALSAVLWVVVVLVVRVFCEAWRTGGLGWRDLDPRRAMDS